MTCKCSLLCLSWQTICLCCSLEENATSILDCIASWISAQEGRHNSQTSHSPSSIPKPWVTPPLLLKNAWVLALMEIEPAWLCVVVMSWCCKKSCAVCKWSLKFPILFAFIDFRRMSIIFMQINHNPAVLLLDSLSLHCPSLLNTDVKTIYDLHLLQPTCYLQWDLAQVSWLCSNVLKHQDITTSWSQADSISIRWSIFTELIEKHMSSSAEGIML